MDTALHSNSYLLEDYIMFILCNLSNNDKLHDLFGSIGFLEKCSLKNKMEQLKIKAYFQLADYPDAIIIQHTNGEEFAYEYDSIKKTALISSYKNFKLMHSIGR